MANQVLTITYQGQSIQAIAGSAIDQIIDLVGTDNFRQNSNINGTVWEVNTTNNGWQLLLSGDWVVLDELDNIFAYGPDQYALTWSTIPADG